MQNISTTKTTQRIFYIWLYYIFFVLWYFHHNFRNSHVQSAHWIKYSECCKSASGLKFSIRLCAPVPALPQQITARPHLSVNWWSVCEDAFPKLTNTGLLLRYYFCKATCYTNRVKHHFCYCIIILFVVWIMMELLSTFTKNIRLSIVKMCL